RLARLALQHARQHGTEYETATAESELGAVLVQIGEAEEARELLHEAARTLARHGNRREAAVARLRLVRAAFETERYRLATTAMRQVAQEARELAEDAALIAELSRGRGFVRYQVHCRM